MVDSQLDALAAVDSEQVELGALGPEVGVEPLVAGEDGEAGLERLPLQCPHQVAVDVPIGQQCPAEAGEPVDVVADGRRSRDLLDPDFWRAKQTAVRDGEQEDVFPYPEEARFPREAR